MVKFKNKPNKSMKNQILSGIIVCLFIMGAGCTGINSSDVTGTYSKDDKTTLDVYANETFCFTERQGYLMGREIVLTAEGTYVRENDRVIFSGDGVQTTAYIDGRNLIIEGNQYTRNKDVKLVT